MFARMINLRFALPMMTTLLVVGIGAGVSGVATSLLRRLGDELAVERVRTAGIAAQRDLLQRAQDVDVSVRLLAERPTLQRMVESDDRDGQRFFLSRFASTAGLEGCATIRKDAVPPAGEGEFPWEPSDPPMSTFEAGWSVVEGDGGGSLWIVAVRPMAETSGVLLACGRRIDESLAAEVARQIGLPVRILTLREARASAGTRLSAFLGAAADEGRAGTGRVKQIDAFVDVRPLSDPSGAVRAVMEARLDGAAVDESVQRLGLAMWGALAVGVTLMAIAAFLLARRLTEPLAELTRASARIGSGDMSLPVPRWSRGEAGQLATTMENMRTGLLTLTSELHRRHAEMAAILNGIVEGVWAVDRERRITWMNPQVAELLGIRHEDAIGRFCGDVLNPDPVGGVRPCETHCPIVDARFRGSARAVEHLVLRDGTRRTVVITSSQAPEEGGGEEREARQFQVMRDETEAEAGRRLRDALLANVSHEFRTPLSAQIASLEMLKERLEDGADPDALELLRSTERGTLRLMRLVDNLLESLRIDSGLKSIRARPVRMDEVIEEAIEQTSPLLEQKRQVLDVKTPAPYPEMLADAPRLVQVLVNLLANASKFAPAGSTIRIGGDVTDTEITVWVRDEGPGFPEEDDAVLFAPFTRASREEPAEPGIGLGLYIAHSIVTRHGGRLVASNADPGARVSVVLPREAHG